MKQFLNLARGFFSLLIVAFILFALLLEMYVFSSGYQSPVGHHTYTFFGASLLVLDKILTHPFSQTSLGPDEHAIFGYFANALVLMVSLASIAYSVVAVTAQVKRLDGLVPYEKFNSFRGDALNFVPFVENWADAHRFVEDWRDVFYRRLSVKKMTHYYKKADRLLIISGNYSWLFDGPWSDETRKIIEKKLPHDVCLISYKTPQELADHWRTQSGYRSLKPLFAAMAFTDASHEHNGSIVKTAGAALYIYLYRQAVKSRLRSSVCAFHGIDEAKALVALVEDDLITLHQHARNDEKRENEKAELLSDPLYFG